MGEGGGLGRKMVLWGCLLTAAWLNGPDLGGLVTLILCQVFSKKYMKFSKEMRNSFSFHSFFPSIFDGRCLNEKILLLAKDLSKLCLSEAVHILRTHWKPCFRILFHSWMSIYAVILPTSVSGVFTNFKVLYQQFKNSG